MVKLSEVEEKKVLEAKIEWYRSRFVPLGTLEGSDAVRVVQSKDEPRKVKGKYCQTAIDLLEESFNGELRIKLNSDIFRDAE